MAKSFYTFIIVPNASSRLHKVRIPVQLVYLLASIGVISFFVAVGLGFSYTKMAFMTSDYIRLKEENTDLKIQKKNLELSTDKLNSKLSALETLSEKLTTLIENDAWNKRYAKLNVGGIGGSKVNYSTADLMKPRDLRAGLDGLKDRTYELETQMKVLENIVERRAAILRITPTIWPLQGRVTSHYGSRPDPFDGDAEMHFGIDIAGLYGTPVRAPADGLVMLARRQAAYGNLVVLNHGNGFTTRLGHLSRFQARPGQKVQKGDIIGYVGSTGRTTAPHLHYEVRLDDRPVNPLNYVPR